LRSEIQFGSENENSDESRFLFDVENWIECKCSCEFANLTEFDCCGEFANRHDSSGSAEIESLLEPKYGRENVGASDPVTLSDAERDLEGANWTELPSKLDKFIRRDSMTCNEIETG
jgi:hypothetical protein